MADEITINANVLYSDSEGTEDEVGVIDLLVDVSTKLTAHLKQNVGTSEEALKLGDVSSLGYVFIKNLDATNFVNVKTGTGGTVIIKLLPGEVALFRFGSGVTAPYVAADTAACQIEILLISA